MDSKDILKVKTLGEFSMTWRGRKVGSGSKSADSHFTRVVQYLIHNREQGLSRMQLQQLLAEDTKSEDVHNLLRSVLYTIRKKFEKAGLPKAKYIEFREGNYYWSDRIPVVEDAREFEQSYRNARDEEDPELRGRAMLQTCYLYGGEFLPHQTRLAWVAHEDTRYRLMFNSCVEEAARYLRDIHNWIELATLGRYASRVCPFNEWETLTIEALTAEGKYDEAMKVFEEAATYYQEELGMQFSLIPTDSDGRYIAQAEHPESIPENILKDLSETEEIRGGYSCPYPVFQGIYRTLCRSLERWDQQAYLMVCTLRIDSAVTEEQNGHLGEKALKELPERLEEIICHSIRKGDVVCKYSGVQFLIILQSSTVDSCRIVRNRISRNFKTIGSDLVADFSMSPIYRKQP